MVNSYQVCVYDFSAKNKTFLSVVASNMLSGVKLSTEFSKSLVS